MGRSSSDKSRWHSSSLLGASDIRPPLPASNIIHLDGRDTGKSVVLSTDALHFATTTQGGQGLIAAPHQGHLDSLIEEIDFQVETSEMLRALVALNQFGKLKYCGSLITGLSSLPDRCCIFGPRVSMAMPFVLCT